MVSGSALPFAVAASSLAQHSVPAFPSLPRAAASTNTQHDAMHAAALPPAGNLPFHKPLTWHPQPAGRQVRPLARHLLVARCQQLPNSTTVSSASAIDEQRDPTPIALDTNSSDSDAGGMLEGYGDAALLAEREPDSLSVVPETVREPVAGVDMEGSDFRVVSSSMDSRIDYLGESTKGDMKLPLTLPDDMENEGWRDTALLSSSSSSSGAGGTVVHPSSLSPSAVGPISEVARAEAEEADLLLTQLGIPPQFPHGLPSRGIFCSRTLNLRSITTIGYDMDYTLIHYNVNAWEGRAYDYAMENLKAKGYPVEGLHFDPDLVIRGLIMDKEKGNLVKADRFGYVKRAMHGTQMLSNKAISKLYGRELVDLRNEGRWEFLNTLFSVSEAVVYMQMVDRLDQGMLPAEVAQKDYSALHKVVSRALFRAHVEGQLKAEIINSPEKFVEVDPELPIALLDQKQAGKRLLLITNSDFHYSDRMMTHAFDRFLPAGMTWRSLFDMVIVSARKPEFFSQANPLYEIVTEDGLMRPCFKAVPGGLYCGGSAQMVERALGFAGDETLYVGDHIYTDVSQSKLHLRWRTCLICRELEQEVEALALGASHRQQLLDLMEQKDRVGDCFNQLRLALQRHTAELPAQTDAMSAVGSRELVRQMQRLLMLMERLDDEIALLLETDGADFNTRWGYISRAGLWDKSHLTRQIEKYADIYTSRVSNFLRYTPFMYFRSQGQTTAHDHKAQEENCST